LDTARGNGDGFPNTFVVVVKHGYNINILTFVDLSVIFCYSSVSFLNFGEISGILELIESNRDIIDIIYNFSNASPSSPPQFLTPPSSFSPPTD